MDTKLIIEQILKEAEQAVDQTAAESPESKFKYKGNVIVIDAGLTKDESRQYAAEVFKGLRNVPSLVGKTYTITVEIQPEAPVAPTAPETPEVPQEPVAEAKEEPGLYVVYASSGRNNGTAVVMANSKADAKKTMKDSSWLTNGKVDKALTFTEYCQELGLDQEEEKEEMQNRTGIPSKMGDWEELEWGS